MARRQKKQEEGAPLWVLTYGDMMSLLLCFFIMLVAMSEIRQDDSRYQQVVQSIQEVFGYRGGVGRAPTNLPPDISAAIKKLATAGENVRMNAGESKVKGQPHKRPTVRTIRQGQEYAVGGLIEFQEGRADLSVEAKAQLMEIADKIRGYTLKIDVRGHSSKAILPADSPFDDHMELSIARARAVRDWLVDPTEDHGRIDTKRVSISGLGYNEPVMSPAYEKIDQMCNDRVEIIMTEALVQEFQGNPSDLNKP
ncbi:MAG: OmpA family protein [Planctomycetes bacterium]|nr:OmpA family protein [Planctomycetota bacterium]